MAFDNFEIETVAKYDDAKVKELMNNSGIVRNSAKINAAINNAKVILALKDEGISLNNYIWNYVDGTPINNNWDSLSQVPGQTELSKAMSKQMKKDGFKFLGPTTCYAFMQATGMVNDHIVSCIRHNQL